MDLSNKVYKSQINNYSTYLLYKNQCVSLAENVFTFKNIDDEELIDISYVNNKLLREGSIAWFKDEVMGVLLALPYRNLGVFDVYGRPTKIEVYSETTRYRKILENNSKKKEFVIMYDNTSKNSIFRDVLQYSERIASNVRVGDINVNQQKTPRIWKTSADKKQSMIDLLKNVEENVDSVMTYEDIDLDDSECILAPAPYVTDKIDIHTEKIWNEFLRFIGISNLTVQKKERNITDEIKASQGGTVASRNSRFETRQDAVNKINKYFNCNITVEFYDGVPTTSEDTSEEDKLNNKNDENNKKEKEVM